MMTWSSPTERPADTARGQDRIPCSFRTTATQLCFEISGSWKSSPHDYVAQYSRECPVHAGMPSTRGNAQCTRKKTRQHLFGVFFCSISGPPLFWKWLAGHAANTLSLGIPPHCGSYLLWDGRNSLRSAREKRDLNESRLSRCCGQLQLSEPRFSLL